MSRREAFLVEMGLAPLWTSRSTPQSHPAAAELPSAVVVADEATETVTAPAETTLAAFDAAGLEQIVTAPGTPSAGNVASMNWPQLKSAVAVCTKCGLCQGRTQSVFGVGDEKAKWLFIGEGPGRNEDLTGEPFVGKAGKLLDNMLLAMGLKRGDNAYIANIVKCRPTDATGKDRPPTPEETAACMPYLERQIELIQPDILVALGKTAALSLLGLDPETPVSKLRGKVHQYAGRPLVVTYHPAYLLRNMVDKQKSWADLCLAMATHANAG